jgi:hypothetical protein
MSTDITLSNNEEAVTASPSPTPPHKKLSRRRASFQHKSKETVSESTNYC